MILQAAKIIGSGLATIGLTNILLSLLTENKKLLLSSIIYTNLAKKAIDTIDKIIINLPNNSLLLKFLNEEIPKSILKINGIVNNNNIEIKDFVDLSLNNKDREIKKILNVDFLIAGVYIFISPNNERYLGSCINFNERLSEHKDQFNNRRKPTILHLHTYKYLQYK
jgi:hypothetical protein